MWDERDRPAVPASMNPSSALPIVLGEFPLVEIFSGSLLQEQKFYNANWGMRRKNKGQEI